MCAATKTNMTKEHKDALAQGRREGAAVRKYLEAIAASKGKRGRKRTPASVERRIAAISAELEQSNALDALLLRQRGARPELLLPFWQKQELSALVAINRAEFAASSRLMRQQGAN